MPLSEMPGEAPASGGGAAYMADLEAEAGKLIAAQKAGDAKAYARAFRNMHEMCADGVEDGEPEPAALDDEDDDTSYLEDEDD
jgi:hypothetical protein